MRAKTVRLSDVGAQDADAWRGLSSDAVEPNPYFDVDFLRTTHRRLRPDVDPWVVLVGDDDGLCGVLPYVQRRSRTGVVVRSTGPPLGSTVVDLQTPLLRRGRHLEASRGILAEVGRGAYGAPVVVIVEQQRLDGPAWDGLVGAVGDSNVLVRHRGERGAVLPGHGSAETVVADLPMPHEPVAIDATMLGHLAGGRRKSLNRSLSGLVRELGPVTWSDRSDDPQAILDFIALERQGWKGDVARGGEGVATRPDGARWLAEVAERLRDADELFVGELRAGDVTLFATIDLRAGDWWFGMRDAYDERFSRFGVGNLGRLSEIRYMEQRGLRFDSSANPQTYPQASALYPGRLPVGKIVYGANAAGRAALRIARTVERAREAVRR